MFTKSNLGIALVVAGLGPIFGAVLYFIWFWISEIIPFFWSKGNPWPAVIPACMIAIAVGGSLAESTTPATNKES